MSQAAHWLDGFAALAARLGVRAVEELRELLPPDAPLPPWWGAATEAPSRGARVAVLASAMGRLHHALEDERRGATSTRSGPQLASHGVVAAEPAPGPASSMPARAPGPPTRRVWPAELVRSYRAAEAADAEAKRRAEATALDEASGRAQAIVAEATKRAEATIAEADRILAEAKQALAEAHQQAASARAEAEREGRDAAAAADAAARLRLRSAEARGLAASEGLVLYIAGLLAERLIGHALASEPGLMVDLAREATRAVVRARRVTLHVHPTDADALRDRLDELGLHAAAIDVRADGERPRGGLRVETDLGTLEADLAPQIDRLVDALRGETFKAVRSAYRARAARRRSFLRRGRLARRSTS